MDVTISKVHEAASQEVTIKGWMFNKRSSGSIHFLQLRDGSGRIQVVVSKSEVDEATWNACEEATIESSLIVTGIVKVEPRSKSGYELQGTNVVLVAKAEEYPIGKKDHGPDFLLDNRHLWLRSARQEALMRIRDEIVFAVREFFHEREYVNIDSPIFTGNACEGTSNLFEVGYFDEKAYLSQSGQLYQEAASAALGKTFCFGPTFRAEKSKTRRHLTEFWMLEAETSFFDYEQNMQLQEDMIVHIVKRVLKNRMNDLKTLERDITKLEVVAQGNFPRIAHKDAIAQLQKLGSDIKENDDLGADDETILTKQYDRPIFITKYPAEVKSFYMKPDPQDESRVLCADLLASEGYGEICGGSQRIDDLELLRKKILDHNLPESAFAWYLDLRKYGSVPHSGFGMGLERVVTWISGTEHVREAIPFPRLLNRLYP